MSRKTNIIPFRLINITTEQFAVFQENYEIGDYEFSIDLNTNISISSDQKIVGVFTKYSFSQKNGIVLVLECACHFKINEEYWESQINDESLTLEKGLLTHFLVLTVGTSRGVLHAKKPKWIEKIILPTLSVASLIKEDMLFDLKGEEEKYAENQIE